MIASDRTTAGARPRERAAAVSTWAGQHRGEIALALVVVALGLGLRAWVGAGPTGTLNLDEATVALQAEQIRSGQLSVFFPNQGYGGTLEPMLVALSFLVLGATPLAVQVVPVACGLATAVVCVRVAARLGLGPVGQAATGILAWCWPAYAVAFSIEERGFYGVAPLIGMVQVLLVLRLSGDGRDRSVERRDLLALGLALGLGWWQTPLSVLVAVPAGAWLVARRPRVVLRSGWAAGAAVVGAAPWLAWNLAHDWASFDRAPGLGLTWWDRVVDFWERLSTATGLATPFDPDRALVGWSWAGAVLVVAVLAVATARTLDRAPGLLAVLVVGHSLLYGMNSLVDAVGPDIRYQSLVLPVLAVAGGAVVPEVTGRGARTALLGGLAAGAVALAVWGITGLGAYAESDDVSLLLGSQDLERVAALLDEREVGTAVTDVAGAQITFLTDGRVRASSFAVPRFPDLERAARRDRTSTYVLDDRQLGNHDRLRAHLEARGVGYEEVVIGLWHVVFVDGRVLPEEVPIATFGDLGG
ncbi:MAG TPA: hypothetical protein VEW93_15045 [Acidimicrobiales bacterium]|nr:hypothetical protein [Acidimicrobiales bacterium]